MSITFQNFHDGVPMLSSITITNVQAHETAQCQKRIWIGDGSPLFFFCHNLDSMISEVISNLTDSAIWFTGLQFILHNVSKEVLKFLNCRYWILVIPLLPCLIWATYWENPLFGWSKSTFFVREGCTEKGRGAYMDCMYCTVHELNPISLHYFSCLGNTITDSKSTPTTNPCKVICLFTPR